jgi:hypothetical protein
MKMKALKFFLSRGDDTRNAPVSRSDHFRIKHCCAMFILFALQPAAQTRGLSAQQTNARVAQPADQPLRNQRDSAPRTIAPASEQAIPFELRSGFLVVVEGRIGSLTPVRFVLDTGTTHSMMDTKIAARLGLPRKEGLVVNLDRKTQVSWTNVPELQVGPLKIQGARMMVSELSRLTEFAEGIDGVIGLDVLGMCRAVNINFETMQIVFRTDGRSEQAVTGPLLVRLEVQGEPLRLVLDTGARDIFLYEDRVRVHARGLTGEHQAARAWAGWMKGKITPRLGIRLGEREFEGSAFLMKKAPNSLPVEIDGYLGLGLLNARYVELDFEASMLRYIKREPGARTRAGSDENGRDRPGVETTAARIALAVVH